jgi:hypothetical protein
MFYIYCIFDNLIVFGKLPNTFDKNLSLIPGISVPLIIQDVNTGTGSYQSSGGSQTILNSCKN